MQHLKKLLLVNLLDEIEFFFSFAKYTTKVCGSPNLDTTEKVPASATRYPISPYSVGPKIVANIRKKIANNADEIILPATT